MPKLTNPVVLNIVVVLTNVVVLALMAGTLLGCDQDIFLSGKWFTTETESADEATAAAIGRELGCVAPLPATGEPDPCATYMELSLGHFGEDVVGWLRLWEDERAFTVPANLPCECACQQVDGNYRPDSLVFSIKSCHVDETGQWTPKVIRVEMGRQGSGEIRWSFDASDSAMRITLTKTHDEGQLTATDKAECAACEAARQ
ncbi:MAG: hypothetical protein ACI9OJ_001149 [Myxococcota bacterium]|jgi:hypothetical protein